MIRSLAPVWDRRARVLILGSMPGAESLRQQQYYAHPRNAFWPLMAALLDVDAAQPYAARLQALRCRGVAIWDVLESCERLGSLDSDIRRETEQPNAIARLLERIESPQALVLNGRKAEAAFQRFHAPAIRQRWPALAIEVLPSTSPAHAVLRFNDKQAVWSRMLAYLDPPKTEASAMAKKKSAAKKIQAKPAKLAKAVKKTAVKPKAKPKLMPRQTAAKKGPVKSKATKSAARSRKPATAKSSGAAPKSVAKKKAAPKPKRVSKAVSKTPVRATAKKPRTAAPAKKAAPAPKAIIAPAQAPKKMPAVQRQAAPIKPKSVAKKPKPAPKPKPPRRPRKPTIVAGELVELRLFKQPLRVPEPWQFGGIAPHEHLHDHGVKAQPDAERLAGKSRKVH